MGNEKKWADHAGFLKEMAFNVGAVLLAEDEDKEAALSMYTGWLAENCFNHAEKHMRDADKINPGEQNEGVAAREGVKVDTGMYDAWNEAKKGPVSTQEEIIRFREESEGNGI